MNFYHRDIKPDNIFFVGSTWKIGDLGLIDDQDKNHSIDKIAEWVGPRGWMSPESMNKYLTENKGFIGEFNVKINHQSDIFQLGKVFWYIFQHNAPIGNISESDFVLKEKEVYPILRTMLNHSTKKRYEMIDEVIYLFTKIESKSLRLKGKF
jgi:serine/threonine protein kinase